MTRSIQKFPCGTRVRVKPSHCTMWEITPKGMQGVPSYDAGRIGIVTGVETSCAGGDGEDCDRFTNSGWCRHKKRYEYTLTIGAWFNEDDLEAVVK